MPGTPDRASTARRHRETLERIQRDAATLEGVFDQTVSRRGGGRRFAGMKPKPGRGSRVVLELPDELLVRADDRTEAAVGLVRAAGLRGRPVAGLRRRVVRVETGGRPVDALRASLAAAGMRTSVVQLSPTRVVMKNEVTPRRPPETETPASPPSTPSGAGHAAVPLVVIDTGLAVKDRQDGWLDGLQDDHNADPLDVWPEENGYLDLAAGHGTFVAGLVQRVDPQLDLSVVKVVDSDGLADEVEVAVALVAAVEEHLAPGGKLVVNLSLGSETLDDLPPVALEVALEIVREIEAERGGEVLVVAAAGNDGSDVPCWPAAFAATDPRVVAVAALGADGSPAGWSTHGSWVTCSSEGEAVLSTYVTGREDPDHQPEGEEPDTFGADAWAWWTGTSFAAPQVAAAVASQARTSGSSLADALGAVLARATGHHPDYGALLPPLV